MKKITTFILLLFITVSTLLLPHTVNAATPVSISVSKSSVTPGDTVAVSVGVNVNLGSFDCTITYDSARMEFLPSNSSSSVSNPSEGRLKAFFVTMGGVDVSGSGLFKLVFKAKSLPGPAMFAVNEATAADYTGEPIPLSESSEATVNVKAETAPPVTLPPTTTTTTPKQTPLVPVETIPPSTTTTTTTEATTTETTKPFKAVDHAGRSLAIAEYDLESLEIPSGYEPEERVINGNKLTGFYSEDEDLFLAYLSSSGGEPHFYFYNTALKSFIPYLQFTVGEEIYHVTYLPDELMPYQTTRTKTEIKGVDLPVLAFDFDDYISLDEYMTLYQEYLNENENGNISAGHTDGVSSSKLTPIDVEVEATSSGVYLLALQGKDKKIERFLYSSSLDQLLHYDLLLVPAFGTFLDENFKDLASEDPEATVMPTEPVTEPTVAPTNEASKDNVLGRTITFFGRDFALWQIIAAAALILLIVILGIVMIIKSATRRKRAEYLFADDFLADNAALNEEETYPLEDDLADIDSFRRPVDDAYPDDFPEVRDLSEIGDGDDIYFRDDYQPRKINKQEDHFSEYTEREDQEDQEEI
ncbi:MAG: cohesin domain-containing protein [Eubacteriales bacterium]|nr:cohesin domain-containing protein [Eubacteriales bacterium]